MLRIMFVILATAGFSPVAQAQSNSVDPRAVMACQEAGGTFVQINDCLPNAHIAVLGLDAFRELYPPEAKTVGERCTELNSTIYSTFLCVTDAIRSAINLNKVLPEGSSLGDSVFESLIDEAVFAEMEERVSTARTAFPEKRMWGGGHFWPYK